MNEQVDQYISNQAQWFDEITLLRSIVLTCELEETYKWKTPCYTFMGKNILLINSLKNFCAIGFFKGILLQDDNNLLHAPGINSQSVRMLKFTTIQEITDNKSSIVEFIYQAIEIEDSGIQIKKKNDLELSPELVEFLNKDFKLHKAFFDLTPGRQRGYHLHFSSAKQAKTRISRIEKSIPKILAGYGFHDCTCGLSKRMPTCDGSHKLLIKS